MEGITENSKRTAKATDLNGAIMALSKLTQIVSLRHSPKEALKTAIETAAALLRVDSAVILVNRDGYEGLKIEAATGSAKSAQRSDRPIGEEIAQQAMATCAPVVIQDTSSDNRPGCRLLACRGVKSAICVPLYVETAVSGAILVMSKRARKFTVSEIQLLHSLASQSALAIWKSRASDFITAHKTESSEPGYTQSELINIANRKIEELSIVNRVSQAVVSTLDLERLLNIILDEGMAAVGAGTGSLMLLGDDGFLRIEVARGLPQSIVESVKVPLGQGIAGRVAVQGQPALITKGKEKEFAEVALRPDITSAMSVPLFAERKVLGVLNVSTIAPNREFGPRDLEILTTLANQMAMAIYNARLHDNLQKRTSELTALLEIAHTLTGTLELDEVLQRISNEIGRLVNVDVCTVVLFDELSGRLRFGAGYGLQKTKKHLGVKWAYIDLAQLCANHIAATGLPVFCEDVQDKKNCPYYNVTAKEAGLHSMVGVPFKVQDRVIGAAVAYSRNPQPFNRYEIDLLKALGELGGIAIQNARIYQHKYNIASLTQNGLTPKVLCLREDGYDVGHRFFAAREVGGDYYDFVKVGPGKIGIMMADVAGSSVRAAAYTSMARNVLRAYAREEISPSKVLSKLNNFVREDTEPELFVSMFYAVLDLQSKEMTYCLAGHEPPILFQAKTGRCRRLIANGMLLGILPDIEFEEKKVKLNTGDILAIFTDGLTETKLNHRQFGIEPVKECLRSGNIEPAQNIADNIYTRLLDYASNRIQDDVALLIIKAI